MYLTGLPEELLDAICQQTDVLAAPEYVALARCCRAFRRVAHHHLYRRLLVSSSKHNLHLIPRLAKSRELASLVRDLTVSIANPTTNVFRTFYQMLAIALCNTTQLVHLTLDVAPDASWVLPSRALHEHSPLIHFASSFPLDVHVTQFIQTTPRLLHIKLGSMQSNSTGSLASMASCCPHQLVPLLSSFEGSVHDARTLVPGHPITVAHLHGPVPVHMIPLLAHSTSNIQVLSVTTSSPLTALLPALIEHLPELTRLQIATTSPNNAFNDEVYQLARMHLHTL